MTRRYRLGHKCRECRYWEKTHRGYGKCTYRDQFYTPLGAGAIHGSSQVCVRAWAHWDEFRRKEEPEIARQIRG